VNIPPLLGVILHQTPELANAYLTGGCVRDSLLNIPVKDYDIEVFNVTLEALIQALKRWGKVDLVGKSFGVIKLQTDSGDWFEFTLPRQDTKVDLGHKGFNIQINPTLSLKTACSRRDYTINALLYDPRKNCLLDFFEGEKDLRNGRLRHVSTAFVEDPLRVLRGMQFASRFALAPVSETVQLCRSIFHLYRELPKERIREEWLKWATRSTKPSAGLQFLEATGWIQHYPELSVLSQTPQDIYWHPEGNVFVHTCHACDALVMQPKWQAGTSTFRTVTLLATLTHDLGKATTTKNVPREGMCRVISPGHEEAGTDRANQLLERIGCPLSIAERVIPLVRNHLAHLQEPSVRSIRRLANKLQPASIEELCLVMAADHGGRPPLKPDLPQNILALQKIAQELELELQAPEPILKGRHLLAQGIQPGPIYGTILSSSYEAQLEGEFESLDQAVKWLHFYLVERNIVFQKKD